MSSPLGFNRRPEPLGEIRQTASAESGSAPADGATQCAGIREARGTHVPSGYKRTEVGVIPESWTICELRDLFAFKNGLNKAKRFFGIGTRIVNYMDVFQRPGLTYGDLLGRVSLTRDEINSYRVRMGDVFFTRTSETAEEIGIASVMLDEPVDTVFSGFVLRARPRDSRLNDAYKQFCFASRSVRSQVVSSATYTTRALTNGSSLSAVKIPLPPLPDQCAIAAVLSDVDALIGSLVALIAKKRAIKRAAMQQLLTGRMRLPGFEGEWETRRLGQVAEMASGGTPLTSVGAYYDGGIPWVSINDMTSSGDKVVMTTERTLSRFGLDNSAARLFPAGTVLYAMYASIGECSIAGRPLCTSQAILGIQPGSSLRSAFLYYSLTWMKRRVKTLGQQGTQANLNKEMVQGLLLPLPPLPEQGAIAAVLTDMDDEIAALECRLDKTRAIKQGMMQQLLTGAIRLPIPDAVAEDEPGR